MLHVYRTYFPDTQGGLEEAIRQICRATGPLGVRNTVFTLSDRPRPTMVEMPEARVVRVRKAFEVASCGFATPAGVARFAREARGHDLIHYHLPWPFADLLHLGCGVRTPAIATYHSDIVRQRVLGSLYRPLMRRFLGTLQRVITTSPQYARTSPMLAGLADRVAVIPLTIDPASYPRPDAERVRVWRARLGDPYFLFIGVLRYYKGLDYLLEAGRAVPHAIAIAGEGPEGERLRRLAAARGLAHVHFLGRVSDADKVALLEGARAVVFPSHLRSEAFGVTLLEGALHARALVSCEIGTGTSHVNVDGETGIVVPPADGPALAAAMDRLAGDAAMAARLGAGARSRLERHFSSVAAGRDYRRVYDEARTPAPSPRAA